MCRLAGELCDGFHVHPVHTVDYLAQVVRPAIAELVPDFLRRNIRGETDSELLFYLFLGQLHKAGKLDDAHVTTAVAGRAIEETVALCDRVVGDNQSTLDLAAANGRFAIPPGDPNYQVDSSFTLQAPATLVGLLDRFEIWNPERYGRVKAADAVLVQEAFKIME